MRAVASVPPPAAQGQINVTGRLGFQPACAAALRAPKAAVADAAAAVASNVRLLSIAMVLPLFNRSKYRRPMKNAPESSLFLAPIMSRRPAFEQA
jgi:hypothetical protein